MNFKRKKESQLGYPGESNLITASLNVEEGGRRVRDRVSKMLGGSRSQKMWLPLEGGKGEKMDFPPEPTAS